LVNYHPQYIKKVTPTGEVSHIDWHTRYEALAKAVDISFPGIFENLVLKYIIINVPKIDSIYQYLIRLHYPRIGFVEFCSQAMVLLTPP
jgi:hypothetical protein